MRSVKNAVVGLALVGVFAGGAGVAVAASWHEMSALHSDGVRFYKGEYAFNKPRVNHGAFEWKGSLEDSDPGDGHNVYMQAKVEGHGWSRYNGKQRKTVTLHRSMWDGAQAYTSNGYLRACRDRGSLRPDNCSPQRHYSNPASR
ncbi:hypothetical protein GTW43_24065 [Streptomyces sp. SID5785]|nr:hypothetical protein [Streptomyces sp. SID5785]